MRRAERVEETEAIAAEVAIRLADAIERGELEGVLIGLSGQLGAGKTAFVRGFVAALDPERARDVSSPTYSVVQSYEGSPPVRHLDLYRLASRADLEAIGWRDLYFAPGLTLVEWIENVPEVIPPEWVEIRLAIGPSGVREIELHAHGARLRSVLRGLDA